MESIVNVLATIFAGFGLFLVGVKILQSNMQEGTSHSVRVFISKWTPNTWIASLWGGILGFLMQDPNVVGCITGSLYACGVLTLRKLVAMVTWSNVGAYLLLFIVFIDARITVMFLLGIAGFSYFHEKPFKLRYLMGVIFATSLMIFSFLWLKEESQTLIDNPWFKDNTDILYHSYFLAFAFGALGTIICQSEFPVILIAINLVNAKILSPITSISMMYGTQLGLGLDSLIISLGLKGFAKQAVLFQSLYQFLITAIFISLFSFEVSTNIPLLNHLSTKLFDGIAGQLFFILMFSNVTVAIFFTLLLTPICNLFAKVLKTASQKDIAHAQFISSNVIQEPESAIEMLNKEMDELIKRLPAYIENKLLLKQANTNQQLNYVEEQHAIFNGITTEVTNFVQNLTRMHFSPETSDKLLHALDYYRTTVALEECLYLFINKSLSQDSSDRAHLLVLQMQEAIHALLLTMVDTLSLRTPEDTKTLLTITSDNGAIIKKIHQNYLDQEPSVTLNEKATLLLMTNLFERIVWIIQNIAQIEKWREKEQILV